MALYKFIRPLAFALDAEKAHRATVKALSFAPRLPLPAFPPELSQTVVGLHFASPVGLAAGFDKDAEVPDAMLGLGFGFVEIGTVTPKPQAGNLKPRLFRLKEDRAVINRMGFNSQGLAAALARLKRRQRRGIVGVNIGANKDSADRIADYVAGVRMMSPVADYLTVNISSPNTPGLRDLQEFGALEELLGAVASARVTGGPPIFLKVAPDLDGSDAWPITGIAIRHGIDGIIVANTTIGRPPDLQSSYRDQTGGLSGRPLKQLALERLKDFHAASEGKIPLIAAGGIENADDAWERIRAGASLVQLYSAMVYEGPGIARRIAAGLAERLRREGMSSIAEAVGSG